MHTTPENNPVYGMLCVVKKAHEDQSMAHFISAKGINFQMLEEALTRFSAEVPNAMKIRSIYAVGVGGTEFRFGDATTSVTTNADIRHYVCKALNETVGFLAFSPDSFKLSVVWLSTDTYPALLIWESNAKHYVVVEFCTGQELSILRRESNGKSGLLTLSRNMSYKSIFESDVSHSVVLSANEQGDILDFAEQVMGYCSQCNSGNVIGLDGTQITLKDFGDMISENSNRAGAIEISSGRHPIRPLYSQGNIVAVGRQIELSVRFTGAARLGKEYTATFVREIAEPVLLQEIAGHSAGSPDISMRGYVDMTYDLPDNTLSKDKPVVLRDTTFSVVTDTYQLAAMTLQYLRKELQTTPIDVIQLDAAGEILACLMHGAEGGFKEFSFKPEHGFPTIFISTGNDKQYRFTLA